MFYIFAGQYASAMMREAFKSIQARTCIKFRRSYLAMLNTPNAPEFAVVFSKRGNTSRYVFIWCTTYRKIISTHTDLCSIR